MESTKGLPDSDLPSGAGFPIKQKSANSVVDSTCRRSPFEAFASVNLAPLESAVNRGSKLHQSSDFGLNLGFRNESVTTLSATVSEIYLIRERLKSSLACLYRFTFGKY